MCGKRHITFDDYVNTIFNDNKLLKSQFIFKSDYHKIYTEKMNKIALNYFDDKRMQCNNKITSYPYGYFNNNSSINSEIKDNTDKLVEIDNSAIIPKNHNTKDPVKNTNATLDINEIIDFNNDSYADSAKSACIDKIKSANANNNYLDTPKTTCTDSVKSASTKITKQKSNSTRVYCNNINNKSAHSKINYELSALLKIKKVSNTNIIIKKKLNPQAINIKYDLNMLNKFKKVTNAPKNVITFLNKHIIQIIKGNKAHNEINNTVTNTVIHDNIKKVYTIPFNKVHIENNIASNASKKTHKNYLKMCLSK